MTQTKQNVTVGSGDALRNKQDGLNSTLIVPPSAENGNSAHVFGYEAIKTLAKDTGGRVTDYLVLAPQNDPYYSGAPAQVQAAAWFCALWRQFGYKSGVHLRRMHYQLVSQEDARKPDGTRYDNTEGDWKLLCAAGKYARYLGMIEPAAFVDRRNPDPHIHAPSASWQSSSPRLEIDDPSWYLPTIQASIADYVSFTIPTPDVTGYTYSAADQAYHLEIWVEKSTQNDVLESVCTQYGVNLVTSLGFQSITSVIDLLERITQSGKPARILYVSDFDPAGDGMPTAVARQIEYWRQRYAPDADIALTPVALTRDQVIAYRLPRIPIKDSDLRKGGFQDRHGEGACELDALEALHPGTLAKIVRQAVVPYFDAGLQDRLRETRWHADELVSDAWQAVMAPYADELAVLEDEVLSVAAQFQDRLQALRDALQVELHPAHSRLDAIRQAIREAREDLDIVLPDRPDPQPDGGGQDWLFHSERDYVAQLKVYQAHKTGCEVAS